MRYSLIILCCLFLQACATGPVSSEMHHGKASFEAGDFKEAFHELLPLAAEGKPDAEYAIGYMYYYGYGVALDADTGTFWMRRAASQGNIPAQKALKLIDQEGLGSRH